MDPEYARKKALMDRIVARLAGKPALPADYHPQEISSYSPALKKTGGYSYAPPEAKKENPFAKPQEPRKYQPNFLSLFPIPNLSNEPQEEPEPPKPINQPQNNRVIRDSKGNVKRGNCWYDVKGKLLYCE